MAKSWRKEGFQSGWKTRNSGAPFSPQTETRRSRSCRAHPMAPFTPNEIYWRGPFAAWTVDLGWLEGMASVSIKRRTWCVVSGRGEQEATVVLSLSALLSNVVVRWDC